jgi:hypothetical protein
MMVFGCADARADAQTRLEAAPPATGDVRARAEHGRAKGLQVDHVVNEVRASALRAASWRKSSFSNPSGNCVEAAQLPDCVAVRNSRFPDGPALVFTGAEWDAFLRGVKVGDFG